MDFEPRPRDGRPSARRLKDISHLYISTGRRSATRTGAAARAAPSRRALRLAVSGPAPVAVRVEIAANLALQFARLGRRTVVVDLDPALPNVGFRLALEPPAYLGHLDPAPRVRCERGLLGIRIVEGVAGRTPALDWPAANREELSAADCVLVSLGDAGAARDALGAIGAGLAASAPATTLARAAPRSPMIGAWLATARRPAAADVLPLAGIEAALWVVDAGSAAVAPLPAAAGLADLPFRTVVWGASEGAAVEAWARVPWHPKPRLPIAALEPEHPASRLYEGLAQSLLAGFGNTGGSHA